MSDFPPRPLSDDEWAAARIEGTWQPQTMAAAEWAAQRLSEAVEARDADRAEVAEYVASVRAWAEQRLTTGAAAETARDVEFFERALKAYAREMRAASIDRKGNPRVKTVKLPSATLETKAASEAKPKITITDMAALVKWAEVAHPDLVTKSVDHKAIAKLALVISDEGDTEHLIDGDGELIPGVDWSLDDPKEPHVTIRLHTEDQP